MPLFDFYSYLSKPIIEVISVTHRSLSSPIDCSKNDDYWLVQTIPIKRQVILHIKTIPIL